MRPVTRDGLVRPLVRVTRAEVEGYLRARNIAWREDASNCNLRFDRNRIRHGLLPSLAKDWNPALIDTLAGMASVAADEEEYWRGEVDRLAADLLAKEPPAVVADATRLSALPRALSRRLIRRAIELVKGDLLSIDVPHVESVLALLSKCDGSGRVQIPGLDIMRSFEWVRFAPAGSYARPEFTVAIAAPGRYQFPGGEIEIAGDVAGTLELRNWQPGDAYQPAGAPSPRKLKEMFQDARIPLWKRAGWPVLTAGGRIVWAARFGPAPDCPAEVSFAGLYPPWYPGAHRTAG